jgi:hypothetical protein
MVKSRNITALPIVNRGDTDAIFIDEVAAIVERGDFTHVILASVQHTADNELPAAMYSRVMVRLIIPTDRRYEIGQQIAAGPRPVEGWLARILRVRSILKTSRSFATATYARSASVLSRTAISSWLRRVVLRAWRSQRHLDGSDGPG